jgi:phosphoglycerate dehydrogenase-like enzyme
MTPLHIWTSFGLDAPAQELFDRETSGHTVGRGEDDFARADVVFGQFDPSRLDSASRLRWVHITSAGYTPYDTPEFRAALREKKILFTNSSHVYDEPCAQHALAMMLALSRDLPGCLDLQTRADWQSGPRRAESFLLREQQVLLLGWGAIAQRLAQMLAPFGCRITALRRRASASENGVRIIGLEELEAALNCADHVVNALPLAPGTEELMNRTRLAQMKPGARFYNVGRGKTVDQDALIDALNSGHIAAAYLDVTEPEPPPREDAVWRTPNLFVTPHSAGGHSDESLRLVRHFASNLRAFEAGQPLHRQVLQDD